MIIVIVAVVVGITVLAVVPYVHKKAVDRNHRQFNLNLDNILGKNTNVS